MRIVLDAMGGDRAPAVPVAGAIEALRVLEGDFSVILVGDEKAIQQELEVQGFTHPRLTIHPAAQAVGMSEPPSLALKKKDSSLCVGIRLQKEGAADAFISAGNTGAIMAQSLLTLGRIERISRPAIVTIYPTRKEPCALLDVGANVDSKPQHLFHFALMGSVYAQEVLGRASPRVGLLNIGEESTKGNELSIQTYQLLAGSTLNFIGNVEGRDIIHGNVDVVVCDGFVGNVVLKLSESIIHLINALIQEEIRRSLWNRVGAYLMRPAFAGLRKTLDYAEYGGAPLLGIDGISIVCHGGSSPKAIRNAIHVACRAVERGLNRVIQKQLNQI